MNKPLILAIETSGTTCGIALAVGNKLIAEYSVFGRNLHDKLNSEFIKRILNDNEYNIEDLDAVAVSAGPGSFTGLRIGGSIAKGICFEDKPKLIAAPTLMAIAAGAVDFANSVNVSEIIAVINSHKDLLYYQKFDLNAEPKSDIVMTTIEEFKKIDPKGIALCGTGADIIEGALSCRYIQTLRASFISELAYKLYIMNQFTKAEDYEPVYVQEFKPKTSRKKLDI